MDLHKLIKEHYTTPNNTGDVKKLIKLNNVNYEFNKNLKITKSSILLPKTHKLIAANNTIVHNAIANNSVASNALANNAIASNAIAGNAIAGNVVANNAIANRQLQYNRFVELNLPHIQEMLISIDGIVLCGSGALYPYSSQNEPILPNSFNLFLYNNNKLNIRENIKNQNIKIIKILQILNKYRYVYNICIVKGCIKITTSQNIIIKIILKNYKSISEILYSFDLPSRAIAYDGITTYLTKLSAWSLVTKLNVIIPSYIEDIYETALIKYFNRGYGIVFPYLKFENNSTKIANLHLTYDYVNNDIAIGTIQLTSLDLLSASFANDSSIGSSTNSGYVINIDRKTNIIENNYYQILFKNDQFQHVIYSAELLTPASIIDFKISNLLHSNDYIKWLYGYMHANLIIKNYNKYSINEEFLKAVFGNYEALPLINTQLKELNKRISFLNASKIEGKIFILKDLIDTIITTESKKLQSINNLKIDWNIYLNTSIKSNLTYEEWYGPLNFKYISKYIPHDLNSIQQNINTYIDKLNLNSSVCSLCLHNIHHLVPNTIKLKCGHLFHEALSSGIDECKGIDIWLQKNNSCPECRNIDPKKKIPLDLLIF